MKKRSILFCVILVVLTALFVNMSGSVNLVKASEKISGEKVVISVKIKEGDTLWGIASEYYTDEYRDIIELIDAIKKCNGISDNIKIGQKVLVPCYKVVVE